MHRLLIISCGKRKRLDPALLPALERYDGPMFRVLRRYLAMHPTTPPDIYILSSKFGLIPADRPIPYYDQRLTPQRAAELRPSVRDMLVQILAQRVYEQILLAVGRDYAMALDGYAASISKATLVAVAHGSQGKRLAHLHDWLYGPEEPGAPKAMRAETHRTGRHQSSLRLRGVNISYTADQVLARARQALATDSHGCDRFHSWYVLLDGERVAPKWLVSQLTGHPASAFTTQEALRALTQLGIVVHRSDLL
jgi:uncharacterized protein DUF6884